MLFSRKRSEFIIIFVARGSQAESTSFPGFSPTRPYGARERERERERDPDWVWSHGSRTKLILRKESFVSQFFCPVRFHCSHNDRKGKIDLLSLQLIYRFSQG